MSQLISRLERLENYVMPNWQIVLVDCELPEAEREARIEEARRTAGPGTRLAVVIGLDPDHVGLVPDTRE